MIPAKAREELDWFFNQAESDMGIKSNFNAMIRACKEGTKRARVDGDTGDLVNGVMEDLHNEDAMIDAIDTRRAKSRSAAATKSRHVMTAYRLLHPMHQRILEAAYEARQLPPQVREAFGRAAGLAPHTNTAKSVQRWSYKWLAGAIGRGDRRVAQIKREAEKLFDDALAAYARARSVS